MGNRTLVQPGPVAPERIESVIAPLEELDFVLEAGLTLNEAVARPLQAAGLTAAAVQFEGGTLSPFHYVMPAPSSDPAHAAWYSQTYAPEGETLIEQANVTFGFRDGAPFTHCHAFWRLPDGTRGAGHILPLETRIAQPTRARAWGTRHAQIAVRPDAETNFSLFTPECLETAASDDGRLLVLARLRPNIEIGAALEEVCRRHGLARARVRGSLGSIVGAVFDDAPELVDPATEFLVQEGHVAPDESGALKARLKIGIVGLSGAVREGWLTQGRNMVCITCEFALEGEAA
ncbi:DUF296 domain-containing protein [Azorhizobium oxalatiphilum]|uniref:DUF296 domain-containing protein n=1 Tax=Azorhizobium oxalatiphilum TaxID=980631 RepID=A0A917BWU8_9HYPH|nr:DUF296 domain-containing protein [Azorhizobium oxalatiphilum]GGF62031.1 DUF296 domain-containing protein [Azorhizobium oxalatiphilum]